MNKLSNIIFSSFLPNGFLKYYSETWNYWNCPFFVRLFCPIWEQICFQTLRLSHFLFLLKALLTPFWKLLLLFSSFPFTVHECCTLAESLFTAQSRSSSHSRECQGIFKRCFSFSVEWAIVACRSTWCRDRRKHNSVIWNFQLVQFFTNHSRSLCFPSIPLEKIRNFRFVLSVANLGAYELCDFSIHYTPSWI